MHTGTNCRRNCRDRADSSCTSGWIAGETGEIEPIPHARRDELQEKLRHWQMPIVTRISEGEVLFDLRTLTNGNLVLLRMALIDILSIGN